MPIWNRDAAFRYFAFIVAAMEFHHAGHNYTTMHHHPACYQGNQVVFVFSYLELCGLWKCIVDIFV